MNIENEKNIVNAALEDAYQKGYEDAKEETLELDKRARDIGRDEAWLCAKTLYQFSPNTNRQLCEDIFDMKYNEMICNIHASEAIDKVNEWKKKEEENKKHSTCKYYEDYPFGAICKSCVGHDRWEPKQNDEINIGDEIITNDDTRAIVLDIDEDGTLCIYDENRVASILNPINCKTIDCKKTGRNFSQMLEAQRLEVAKVLNKIEDVFKGEVKK